MRSELNNNLYRWCFDVPGITILILCDSYKNLRYNCIDNEDSIFYLLEKTGLVKICKHNHRAIFPNGSKIILGVVATEKDIYNFFGYECQVIVHSRIGIQAKHKLRCRLRMPMSLEIPLEYTGAFPKMIHMR